MLNYGQNFGCETIRKAYTYVYMEVTIKMAVREGSHEPVNWTELARVKVKKLCFAMNLRASQQQYIFCLAVGLSYIN